MRRRPGMARPGVARLGMTRLGMTRFGTRPGVVLVGVALAVAGCGLGAGQSGRGPVSPAPATSSRPPATSPPATPPATSPPATPPATSPPATSPPPTPRPSPSSAPRVLALGMSGPDVRALQRRLAEMHYDPGDIDGRFGPDTLEAVWAFQEVQGITVTGNVGPVTRRALAGPQDPRPLVPGGGSTRIEVSLARRILVLYRSGRVALISHVSSGGGYYYCSPSGCGYAITPAGDFATTAFMPGWVTVPLGQMYNPVFFIGTQYAIHGSLDVPLAPASHGCIRIPMHIAEYLHRLVAIPGTPVYVRR